MRNFIIVSIFITGEEYKRHATIVLPLFRRSRILNNLDLIIDCTEKLFDQWRSKLDNNPNHIFLNTTDQCQRLILSVFGLIGFDYDMEILDESNINNKNELTKALYDFIDTFIKTFYMPEFLSKIYLKISPQYRHLMIIINKYLNRMIEQEQSKSPEEIAERKRTSLIASLVTSLQQNEIFEAAKPENEKKGIFSTSSVFIETSTKSFL
jgi:cytochrome P450